MSDPAFNLNSLSDNQLYKNVCLEASRDYNAFDNFRNNAIYANIVECVSAQTGAECLEIISAHREIMDLIVEFSKNDAYGNPILYNYPGIGLMSPSTLRYVKVLFELIDYFKDLNNVDICEIGVGYGGQCRILNAYFKPASYRLVDIEPALMLARCFLDNFIIPSIMSYKTMNELPPKPYDLVISNYAFSELTRPVQDVYLEKIILKSKMGYIAYNQITPDHYKSYTDEELAGIIPGAKIIAERPLTHPRNSVIVWGGVNGSKRRSK